MSADARLAVSDRVGRLCRDFADHRAAQYDEAWWTWQDFAHIDEMVARVLTPSGIADDAAVAVVVRSRPSCLAAVVSVLRQGRCAVLVSPVQSDSALAAELTSLRAAAVVLASDDLNRPGMTEALAGSGSRAVELLDRSARSVPGLDGAVLPRGPMLSLGSDAAITVLTSGTTGPPKRLPVTWDMFLALGGAGRERDPRPGGAAVVLSLPLASLGGVLSIARAVFGGRPLSMMERFEVGKWAALISEHRPRVMGAPPPVLSMILDADIPAECFAGVTAFTTASAPVAPEVAAAFEDRYGIPVLLGYGATEFLASVTGWSPELHAEFGVEKRGSVGRAHRGVSLRVMDEATGDEVAPGAVGLLEVDSPLRARGLPAGWLQTADRARIDEDGFLWILGRADGVIVRGGFKVDLALVERTLCDHPGVNDACVVGLADPRVGSVPGAAVTVSGTLTPDELAGWVRDRLPPYCVPTIVKIVEEIPTTHTLKKHTASVRELLEG